MGVRSQKMNSTLQGEPKSSFLSCEKDLESIIRKLFIEDKTVSNYLKRLINISLNKYKNNHLKERIYDNRSQTRRTNTN